MAEFRISDLPRIAALKRTALFEAAQDGKSWSVTADSVSPMVDAAAFGVSAASPDNTAAMQAWLDYLVASTLPGRLKAGTYKNLGPLVVNAPGKYLTLYCDPGAEIDIRGASPTVLCLYVAGSVGPAVPTTGPIAKGAVTLPVAAGAQSTFALGSLLKLASDDIFSYRDNSWKGELIYVASVASGQINLRTATRDFYDTNPNVYLITPAQLIITGSLKIIGTRDPAHSQRGILCEHAANSLIEDITCDGVSSANIAYSSAIDSFIVRPTCSDGLNPGTGYGLVMGNSTRGCHIEGGYVRNMRHALTISGRAFSQTGGPVRDCSARGLTSDRCWADGFDTHGGFDNFAYIDCVANGAGGAGFNTEGGSISLVRPRVYGGASTGISCTSGLQVKTNVYIENAYVEGVAGIGINVGEAPFYNPSLEPAGIGTVHIVGAHVVKSGNTGLRIMRPTTYTHSPEVVKVIGGTIDGCGTTLATQFSYARNFLISGLSLLRIPAASRAMLCNNAQNGAIRDCGFEFEPGASSVVLALSDCANVSFSGIKVTSPSQAGLRGVTFDGDASGIRSLGDNDFSQTSLPYNFLSVPVVGGTITLPAIITGLVYRVGDGLAPNEVHTILGGRRGDVVSLCGVNPASKITFKHGTGNLRILDGRDVQTDNSSDVVTFSYDDTLVPGWRAVAFIDTASDIMSFDVSGTLGLEHDRKTLSVTSSAEVVITLPSTYHLGFRCRVVQRGSGKARFVPSGGTMGNFSGHTRTAGDNAMVELTVIRNTGGSAAEWLLSGNTAA